MSKSTSMQPSSFVTFEDAELNNIVVRKNCMMAYFYNYNSSIEGLQSSFKLKFILSDSGFIEPLEIIGTIEKLSSGKKMNIEIVDNGFLLKFNGSSIVCTDIHSVKEKVEEFSIGINEFLMPFDEELHKFTNLEDIINQIASQFVNLED